MTLTANDCPSCQALRRDLAAATSRAERAEHAAAIWEQRCSQATALSGQHIGEVAAALQRAEGAEAERDALREALREILKSPVEAAWGRYDTIQVSHALLDAAREALLARGGRVAELTIIRDPLRCGGHPTVGPTRIRVHDVVSCFELYDRNIERILEEYPNWTRDQVNAALEYYRENQNEIDEILRLRRARRASRLTGGDRESTDS